MFFATNKIMQEELQIVNLFK